MDDELIDFLLERLDSTGMEELDGHEPLDLAVELFSHPPNGAPYAFVRGCRACTRDPVRHADGTLGHDESLVEPWPCPHVRALALRFADDPDYLESWRP
ncbi:MULTISPECIES: hypothetical protein [unclassified Streptomyces]|uniref:hypothetical protein n=1 Tax=unclassified Streptomyces TaxID=2593676 RepID=UPI00336A5BEE